MKNRRDRCIALAGLAQAVDLVDSIARSGTCDNEAAEASINSIFQLDAETVEEVYGGIKGVLRGMRVIHAQLAGDDSFNQQQLRYFIMLLQLDKKLVKRSSMYGEIASGIEAATLRLTHYPSMHQNILAQLAEIYSTTVSTLSPRIMVQGDPAYLSNVENINKVRSLLLAGIRSARLLHQSGGGRFQMLWKRREYLEESKVIIRDAG